RCSLRIKQLYLKKGPGGITYRIPALIYLQHVKTFLAFAEKRTSPADHDAKILVMRRGTRKKMDLQELQSATLRDYCPMNPCPVYEKNSKTVFLFFICVLGNTTEKWQICTGENKTRLCYVTSGDNGQTWSEVRDLTESVIGETIHNWATFAVGPGHGVQLENGRLIIPAYAYYIPCRCFSYPIPYTVHPRALSIYSEDEGRTWCLGKMLSKHSCECEMAEIIDHEGRSHLYCNARHTSYRWEALSGDSGASFYEPRCQGSVIGFPAPKHDTQTWLLFMHPTSTTGRSDMGVYLNRSPLHSSKWEEPKIIHTGPSGYSDLAYNGDKGTFSGLMECGKETELENAFVTFTFNDVTLTQKMLFLQWVIINEWIWMRS
uniref:exo-alpha-sialidase n=1 Tax=Neogobius melanostomus TaxID=47308 RepID=A0A8C6SZS2_9GOBI